MQTKTLPHTKRKYMMGKLQQPHAILKLGLLELELFVYLQLDGVFNGSALRRVNQSPAPEPRNWSTQRGLNGYHRRTTAAQYP
jgi:hypothetical protein